MVGLLKEFDRTSTSIAYVILRFSTFIALVEGSVTVPKKQGDHLQFKQTLTCQQWYNAARQRARSLC